MPRLEASVKLVVPFLIGIAVAPLVKPFLQSSAKKAIRTALYARKLGAEAREDLQDMVAEVTAEVLASQNGAHLVAYTPGQPTP